jgi:hypothetical protein
MTRTAIWLIVACFLVGLTPVQAAAQARATAAGGYSYLHELGEGGQDYATGWFASFAQQIGSSRLSIAGEINQNSRKNTVDETQRLLGLLGGVRIQIAEMGRLRIFADGLLGMERFTEPGFDESGFAWQTGGGIDFRFWRQLGVRVQTDFRFAYEEDTTFKEFILNSGAVLRF